MSLYEGEMTKVCVRTKLSKVFLVKVGVHQGSVILPFVFPMVIDVITEAARNKSMIEVLYADYLVLMSDNIEDLRSKFDRWKDSLVKKEMKINTRKTKLMLNGTKGEVLKSRIDPCGICGRKVMKNSVWCRLCGE